MRRTSDFLSQIEQAMERLREATECPDTLRLNEALARIRAYEVHGNPFGRSLAAAEIWGRFEQQTTGN